MNDAHDSNGYFKKNVVFLLLKNILKYQRHLLKLVKCFSLLPEQKMYFVVKLGKKNQKLRPKKPLNFIPGYIFTLFYGDPKRFRRNHRNYFVERRTTRQKAVRKIEKIHFFAGTVKAGGNLKKNLVFALCKTAD